MAQGTEAVMQTSAADTRLRWLPMVRVSGRPRPHTTVGEDGLTMALAGFGLFSLYMDGWRHNNMVGIDTFWAVPHILLYSGLLVLGIWLAFVILRRQDGILRLDWSAVPWGYALAFVALPLAAVAGPADEYWHSLYGFENQIDSTYSPTHQGLFFAGTLLAAIPVAAAWQRRGVAPTLRQFLPAVFSISSVVTMVVFVIHQLLPFYSAHAMQAAFQRDIVSRPDAFAGGVKAVHVEGLSQAIHHFGDVPFPYYFYATHTTMGGILLFSAVLFGAVLLMRRRWRLPAGSLTIMFAWPAVLFPLLSEYREWQQAIPLILSGILGDVLLATLAGRPGRAPVGRLRLFAALMPVALWGMYLVCVAFLKGGLGWGPTLWVGVLSTTAGYGYGLSFLVFPPYMPIEEREPEGAAVG
jgi:hypothetical protein